MYGSLTPANRIGSHVTNITAMVNIMRIVKIVSHFMIRAHLILNLLIMYPPNTVPPAPPGITNTPA